LLLSWATSLFFEDTPRIMPLPPAPTQRAHILPAKDYTARASKTHAAAYAPDMEDEAQDLFSEDIAPATAAQAERANNVSPIFQAKSASKPQNKRVSSYEKDSIDIVAKAPGNERSAPANDVQANRRSAPASTGSSKTAKPKHVGPPKLFVLDTNVLMHDPMALFRFEEHDIYLPMIVLEELDGHKKGMTEVARNARQTSRSLDQLAAVKGADIAHGLKLDTTGFKDAGGRLFFQTKPLNYSLPAALPQGKADNQILGVVEALRTEQAPRDVVLVSKDINMRVKARALGLPADDYQNDKALEDGDLLYTGALALPPDFWDKHSKTMESWQSGGHTYYRITGPVVPQLLINQFVFFEAPGEPSLYARVTEIREKTAVLKTLKDYTHGKNAVWGATARNREQNFAMNLLMDPEVDFVTLAGTAGTGKTLMALAAGLTQVLDDRRYTEIIMTRATVSVGEDIGFLPGTEEEKMGPWMGALDDNLEFLGKTDSGAGEWGRAATNELIRTKIKIKSMNFMRGRTFLNKYVIIDEAQNLTPKQMKTLVTRAGPGTKIICMGNLAQIDTPYLTEGSSGLTFAVDKFKGWPHSGHITLARGERSRLADFASDVL
jgi:PhoH-like ATPase